MKFLFIVYNPYHPHDWATFIRVANLSCENKSDASVVNLHGKPMGVVVSLHHNHNNT